MTNVYSFFMEAFSIFFFLKPHLMAINDALPAFVQMVEIAFTDPDTIAIY